METVKKEHKLPKYRFLLTMEQRGMMQKLLIKNKIMIKEKFLVGAYGLMK